jgi:hypothetical protein
MVEGVQLGGGVGARQCVWYGYRSAQGKVLCKEKVEGLGRRTILYTFLGTVSSMRQSLSLPSCIYLSGYHFLIRPSLGILCLVVPSESKSIPRS